MNKGKVLLALAAAAGLASAAGAEVLEMTGEFAAPSREASLLQSLAFGRIAGEDGQVLEIAIQRALDNSQFVLLAGRGGREQAEGTLSGAVSTGVDERPFRKREKRCVEKAERGKCVREEEVELHCRRRVVNVNADLRIVRSDGRIVYSVPKPFRDEVSWCEDARPERTAEETVSMALAGIAASVRADLVPRVETYSIRVRESTKGLTKPDGDRFKNLVKLTKRDPQGACRGWEDMRSVAPSNPSLLFNLGLCAEQRGDYEGALALYREASAAGAGEGREGAGRVLQLIAGREDAAERRRRG